MDDWMELMWLKPSSPRLAVDASASLRHPLRTPTGRNHLHNLHLLHLSSIFPLPRAHKADKGDSFSGDDPWSPRPGRHLWC